MAKLASAGEGGKKKSDPTVAIVVVIGALLLLLLFGGCGNVAIPWPNFNNGYHGYNGGNGGSHPAHNSHYQCGNGYGYNNRGNGNCGYDGRHRHGWDRYHSRHGSGHGWRRPEPTGDADHRGGG